LSKKYNFKKPNDPEALRLMNDAAKAVMMELTDLVMAYGVSDEYRSVPPHSLTPLQYIVQPAMT
jgi:tRNA(His) guanylyltransferase